MPMKSIAIAPRAKVPPMGRKTGQSFGPPLSLRLSAADEARLEALLAKVPAEEYETRTSLARKLLLVGLRLAEQDTKPKK
jgi:hypothetical protein